MSRRRYSVPLAGGRTLMLGDRALVMGVINVTPDSFSDGGERFDLMKAVEAGMRMEDEGADVIDVGGESTRPGADPLPADEERRRVVPVVEALAPRLHVPLSVDTYKAGIADAALGAGAAMVNDVSGLRYEPALADTVARHKAAIILMHTRGHSNTMYQLASYHDVVDEVRDELRESVAFAMAAGVPRTQILVDPGLGFAKEAPHTYEVLARLGEFAELGFPIVIGPSRKSFLTRAVGTGVAAADRDWATAAAVAACVVAGAHVVRVHRVAEMQQVVRVADEIRRYHRADE